jgi:hypothetical protein
MAEKRDANGATKTEPMSKKLATEVRASCVPPLAAAPIRKAGCCKSRATGISRASACARTKIDGMSRLSEAIAANRPPRSVVVVVVARVATRRATLQKEFGRVFCVVRVPSARVV